MMSSLFDRYLQESDAFGSKNKPELSRAFKCLKGLLVALNVLFLIFGCVLMGIGSVAYNRRVGSLSGTTLPIGIVVLGVFIMFMSFLGCVSAWRESRIFLGLYFFFLSIFTFLLLVVGLAVYVKRNEAGYYMSKGWEAAFNPIDNGVINALQITFECCGLYTYNDTWAGVPCPVPSYVQCLGLLESQFYSSFYALGSAAIAFAVLMVFSLLFVCCLMRAIKNKSLQADLNKLHPSGEDSSAPSVSSVSSSVEPSNEPSNNV